MAMMMKKKLIPVSLKSDYDSVSFPVWERHAAEMLLRRARDEGVTLKDTTLRCMLRAFSQGGRVKEAMDMYATVGENGVVFAKSYYQTFADIVCQENASEEVNRFLIDLMNKGVRPAASELSKFIMLQCRNGRWQETENLLSVILEQGFLTDLSSCHLLVKHYCSSGLMDSAMSLHRKVEKLGLLLDVTYNQILLGLFAAKRVEEAVKVFDFMRTKNVLSIASFLVMISGLCLEKETRKAMKIHDEMLKKGLKPNTETYKRLITVFL